MLKVLLLPEVCYRAAMERKFEWMTDVGKTGFLALMVKMLGRRQKFHKAGEQRRTTLSANDHSPRSGKQGAREGVSEGSEAREEDHLSQR